MNPLYTAEIESRERVWQGLLRIDDENRRRNREPSIERFRPSLSNVLVDREREDQGRDQLDLCYRSDASRFVRVLTSIGMMGIGYARSVGSLRKNTHGLPPIWLEKASMFLDGCQRTAQFTFSLIASRRISSLNGKSIWISRSVFREVDEFKL